MTVYDWEFASMRRAIDALPEGDHESWACGADGYFPGNGPRWCNAGCGSDYPSMEKVATPYRLLRMLRVLLAEHEARSA